MAKWLIDWGKGVAKGVSKLRDTLASAGNPIATEDYSAATVQMMGLF